MSDDAGDQKNDKDNEKNKKNQKEEKQWWQSIPKGAESIVQGYAGQVVLVDLLDGRLETLQNNNHETGHPQRRRPPVNFDAVTSLIRQVPQLCHERFDFQWDHGDSRHLTVLQILCCFPRQVPLSLLQLVYEINPSAMSQPESRKGCLPFHYVCTFLTSEENKEQTADEKDKTHTDASGLQVLKWVWQQHPQAMETPRSDGMYPLHLSIYFQAPLPIVQYLLQAWPQALQRCDYEQWTVLHAAARGQASLPVVHYLTQQMLEWQQAQEEQQNNDEDTDDEPDAVVHPCAVVDARNRTPLHLACRKAGNPTVVQYLVQQAPHTLTWLDATSCTPLFAAARHQTVEVLQILLQGSTQQPPPRNHVGATLLHYAALDNTDSNVVPYLAGQYPDMMTVRTRDVYGYMPLHLACHFSRSPVANIQALVEAAPRTLLATGRRGLTPLQIAQDRRRPATLLQLLQDATQRLQQQQARRPPCG